MPKLEPKQIQKEIEAGNFRPVYWFYGHEQMKSRELLKRLRQAIFGGEADSGKEGAGAAALFASSFREAVLDAQECEVGEVLDAAQSLSLGGGGKLVVVKQAHLLKHPESLIELCGPAPAGKGKVPDFFVDPKEGASVTVFLSKDLDQRKKFSKALLERAACVPCEEIAEGDREAWAGYLAKRRGLALTDHELALLRAMDPWSLDGVERELDKMETAISSEDREAILLGGGEGQDASEIFIEAFLMRERSGALPEVKHFAEYPESALPLLGLLSWNAKTLIGILKDREAGTRDTKLGAFLQDRFARYQRVWSLPEAIALQRMLAEVDFSAKQTPRDPLGTWTGLVLAFCR
jgi:DNA polymerase III delta subunit